ncbi:uncharacterized protein B0P05DRAFT_639404, partial [Gilbertella persicaria]|uniref:uncharacterized protein n=1 Tax=Gilbertella persicaria TaxID=101096 RepID=UPI00221F995F
MASLLVQLVEQGIQKGFVQNVIRTLDKECYLDRHYVQKSIVFLTEKDRKITIEALAEELCIEQSVIKDMVNELSANQNWTVVDDLILTLHVLEYMNNVALDFNKAVESKGYVFTVAQSQALRLPYSLLKTIMVSLMENDNYVSYTQLPDMIATKAYIDKCKSDIQSSLACLEEPFPVFKIQKSLSMPEELFYLLLEQLVKEEGILRGKKSRAVFEPKHYKQRQLTLIKSIFDSNECISKSVFLSCHSYSCLDVDTVESLYSFSSPVDIISSNYDKDSFICLNSCIIKTSVKDKAREVVESVTEYCDVN